MKAQWISPDGSKEVVLEGPTEADLNRQADRLDRIWMASSKKKSVAVEPPRESTLREKTRAVAQGGTFGFQDEIQGALGATFDVLGGNEPLENWGNAYRHHRDDERLAQDIYAITHPEENFTLQFAGGLAVPGSTGLRAASQARNWSQLARIGAVGGGLAGFGTAEGPADAQALQAGAGSVIGAGLGLATPFATQFVSEGAKQAGAAVGQRVLPALRQAARGPVSRIQGLQQAYPNLPPGLVSGPERQRLIQRAKELGFELSPGERTNSTPMRQAEAAMRSSPLSPVGWRLNQARENANVTLNNLVSRAMGTQGAGEVSAATVSRRADELGQLFDMVERQIGKVRIDNTARRDLNQLMAQASNPLYPNRKAMAAIRRLQQSQDFNRAMTGEELKRLRTTYQNEATKAWNGSDANLGELYDGLVDVLEGIVDRQVARHSGKFTSNQRLPAIWARARREWKVVKALRRPGAISGGNVNPNVLATSLRSLDKAGFRDMRLIGRPGDPRADLYDALRINEYFGDIVRDSGTATRSAYNALAGENLLGMVARAGTAAAARPLGSAYMKFGSEGLVRPGPVAAWSMAPIRGALAASDALYGGAFGEGEELEE